jgi:hypothetical protein
MGVTIGVASLPPETTILKFLLSKDAIAFASPV